MAREDDAERSEKPDDSTVIPVVEEQLTVEKREQVTGKVSVVMHTETTEQVVKQTLESIYAHVTRVPVDRELEPGAPIPQMRTENGLTIIPVLEEVMVIEKRLRFIEELHIKQQKTTEEISTPVSLRKQTATVDPVHEPNAQPNPKG